MNNIMQILLLVTICILTSFVVPTKAKRTSEQKCEEWMEFMQPHGFINYLLPPPFNITPFKSISCPEEVRSKLIAGGTDAHVGEYPYQAALGYGNIADPSWRCAGGLISEDFVITAAHCVQTALGAPKYVLLGDINLTDKKDSNTRIIAGVNDIFIHPDYKEPMKYNDLALIKLDRMLTLNVHVVPACLPQLQYHFEKSKWLTVSGWGRLGHLENQSDKLQTANLTFWDTKECNSIFMDGGERNSNIRKFPQGIIPNDQFCAGDKFGNKDTCQGDSGTPAVTVRDIPCVYYIVGITHGGSVCGLRTPGIYTNVVAYLDWIEKIVWSNPDVDNKDNKQPSHPMDDRKGSNQSSISTTMNNKSQLNITEEKTDPEKMISSSTEEEKSNRIKGILGIPY